MSYQQVPVAQWPYSRGLTKDLAFVQQMPSELELLCGLRFEDHRDALDDTKTALLIFDTGKWYALVRHVGHPEKGTMIVSQQPSQNYRADLSVVMDELRLTQADVKWVCGDIHSAP